MNIYRLILLGATVAATAAATANVINDLSAEIVQNDPELRSIIYANRAEMEALRGENQLEAPEVEFEHLWGTTSNAEGNKITAGITQSFQWPGVYGARSQVAARQQSAMDLWQQSRLRDKMLEAKLMLLDIAYLKADLRLVDSIKLHVDSLLVLTDRAYRQGETSILDLNRLRVEAVQMRAQHSQATTALETAIEGLRTLGVSDPNAIAAQLPSDIPVDALHPWAQYELAAAQSPDILAQRGDMSVLEAESRAAQRASLPGFSVGYRYNHEGGASYNGFTVGVTLPFVKKNRQRAQRQWQIQSLEYEIETQTLARQTAARQQWARAQALTQQCRDYADIFASADNLRLLDMAMQGGQISVIAYLTDLNYFLQAQRDWLKTQYEASIETARLNALLPTED